MTVSAIYPSRVTHQRHQPMGHQLRYRVVSVLIDLDEVDSLADRIPGFSHNRWNLVSFNDRDHGPRDGSDLRTWIDGHLAEAGVDITGGSVQLLAFPRLLGYVFNPITVWFARDRSGDLRGILYEVHNTFGQELSHLVVLPPGIGSGEVPAHEITKELHVSPFFDQVGRYRMAVEQPSELFALAIDYLDDDGSLLLEASLVGMRSPFTTMGLLRQFLRNPLHSLKVIGGIHVEAAKLFLKGARYRPIPAPPARKVLTTRLSSARIH